MAAGAIGSSYVAKKASDNVTQAGQSQFDAASKLAGTAEGRSQSLFDAGMPAVNSALGYYQTLLRGSRPAMQQATAGPRALLGDTYSGAQQALTTRGPFAGKVKASAELNRQRVEDISKLTTGVQPQAAGAVADIGTGLVGQAGTQLAGAGNLRLGAGQGGLQAGQLGLTAGGSAAQPWGQLVARLLSQYTRSSPNAGLTGMYPTGGSGSSSEPNDTNGWG